ncbi:MAG: DUF2393 domain-containing protein [Acidobacteriales bacterium]|nr:DUF2393 domain-containing protein [Terriglobales bacterium]
MANKGPAITEPSDGQPHASELFRPPGESEPDGSWKAKGIGFVIVVLAVAIGIFVWREIKGPEPQGPPSYATQLKISDLKLSQEQNFLGATVTYLEGKIRNAGDKTVTSASVSVIFRNSLDEIVQKEILPVRVLDRGGPYPDTVDMRARPLTAGQEREFRLIFEHLSSDWNQQAPEMTVSGLTLQ